MIRNPAFLYHIYGKQEDDAGQKQDHPDISELSLAGLTDRHLVLPRKQGPFPEGEDEQDQSDHGKRERQQFEQPESQNGTELQDHEIPHAIGAGGSLREVFQLPEQGGADESAQKIDDHVK